MTYVQYAHVLNDDMLSARRAHTSRFEICDFFFYCTEKRMHLHTVTYQPRHCVWFAESEERVFYVYIPAAFKDIPKESRGLNDLRVWILVIWSVFATDGASVGVRVFVHTTHTHYGCTLSHIYESKRVKNIMHMLFSLILWFVYITMSNTHNQQAKHLHVKHGFSGITFKIFVYFTVAKIAVVQGTHT